MPTLDWLDRQAAFSVANNTATHVLRPHTAGPNAHGIFGNATAALDNLLIQGDNLQALKALLPFYRGQVKCIFIDPPYNTKSAFEHYDDNLEHSKWLSLMLPRLQVLRDLLSEDGSIWVTIDDNEGHYLKVMMDEVFGRGNFVANVFWEKKFSPQNDAHQLSINHDHVLVYGKPLMYGDQIYCHEVKSKLGALKTQITIHEVHGFQLTTPVPNQKKKDPISFIRS